MESKGKQDKLLYKTISLTFCEAIVKCGWREVERHIKMKYHYDLFFDKTLGIEVVYAADEMKAAKEQKRARRAAAKERKIRKDETMILPHGWDDLEAAWKRLAEKLLDDDRISELIRCHRAGQLTPTQVSMP